jgi:polysaccharide chain length determinant protein (PEP-CTERM system associated)
MNHELYVELQRYARILLSRKRLLVVSALLIATLGFAASYVLPKKFEARSTVFIEQSVISDLVKGIAITPSMDAKIRVLGVSMLSRETLSKVLRILDKDIHLTTDAMRENYLAGLRERIKISLDEKRGVFFITFTDSDPRFARDLVNTLTQVYIESNTASKRDESLEATRFLAEQIETFKKRIDVVEEEINRYKAEHGMQLAVDETVIRYEIADAEKKLEAIRARRFELETKAKLLPTGGGKGSGLAELESQLATLRTTYTENHPKVVRIKGQIAALKASPSRGQAGDAGVSMTRALIEAELDANRGFEERQIAVIEEKQQLLRQIPSIRTELNELLHKKENETLIYNQLVTRYGQSEVSKQMEMENKSMTFRIVDPAVLPEAHVSPNRPMIMGMSMAGGIAFGMALILVPYLLKGAVKSLSDLRPLNQRVFAVIPIIPKPGEELRRKRLDAIFLSLAGVYLAGLLVLGVLEIMGSTYIENLIVTAMNMWQ